MKDKTVIGIDIGGTTITAGFFKNEKLKKQLQIETPAKESVDVILEELNNLIEILWDDSVEAIGIGIPGFLNVEDGTIELINNIPAFQGFCIKNAVQEQFNVPVLINNDANCFALGEYYFGKSKKYKNVIGISLGTGVGGGIIINKKIYYGMSGGAGEFGCIPYMDENYELYCGSNYFTKFHNKTGKELFFEAEANNPEAIKVFEDFGFHLGNLVIQMLYNFAPEAIIFGGSIAKSFKYFEPSLRKKIEEYPVDLIKRKLEIFPAEFDNAGLLGAAALCYN